MKHQTKFNAHLDETYSPVKIYDRLFPFSEVLMIKRLDIYEQMYAKFLTTISLILSDEDDMSPPNSPVTARPTTRF